MENLIGKRYPWQDAFIRWLIMENLSLSEAARRLGIPVSLAFKYRQGENSPRLNRVAKFCVVMGIPKAKLVALLFDDAEKRFGNHGNNRTVRSSERLSMSPRVKGKGFSCRLK